MLTLNKMILVLIALLSLSIVRAATTNVSEFTDGTGANNNLTFTSSTKTFTKYVNIPINSTITNGIIDLIGFNTSAYDNPISIDKTPDEKSNDVSYYDQAGTTDNMTYGYDGNFTTFAYGKITAGNGRESVTLKFYENYTYDNSSDRIKISSKWYQYQQHSEWDFSLRIWCYKSDGTTNYIDGTFPTSTESNETLNVTVPLICKHTSKLQFLIQGSQSEREIYSTYAELKYFESQLEFQNQSYYYPSNLTIDVNGTEVFNHSDNLTGTNQTINFTTQLQTCVNSFGSCDFLFVSSTLGILNLQNLSITYNFSQSANLEIMSPSEISKTTGGGDYAVTLTLNNTGDYNATNCSFQTVSSGTPNLNDQLSYTMFDINNGTSKNVQLTFKDISQSAENDERLQFYCNGTIDGQLVYSGFIDVDIVYESLGGGGGYRSLDEGCNINLIKPRNKVILLYGKYEAKQKTSISLKNNATSSRSFRLSVHDINCKLEKNSYEIQGNSVSNIPILCIFPMEEDTGYIEISSGDCNTKVNVILQSNWIGEIIIYFSGGAGPGPQLFAWGILVALIFGGFYLLSLIK